MGGGGRVGSGGRMGGQDRSERRIEVFGKIKKKIVGGRAGGVWLGKGVRADVNTMLGAGGDVGYGGCEPRTEGIVQCTKGYCTVLRK